MIDFDKLKEPFPAEEINWRVQKAGIRNGKPYALIVAYLNARAVMDRLDEVCGPSNWFDSFDEAPQSGLECGIAICCEPSNPDSTWVTKHDGAENTNIEPVKGGFSDAFKRAAVKWGIGRYLYNFDKVFAVFTDKGKYSTKIGEKWHKWNPPKLPDWALPGKSATPPLKNKENPQDSCESSEVPDMMTQEEMKTLNNFGNQKVMTDKQRCWFLGFMEKESISKQQGREIYARLKKLPSKEASND
jgi:hypothetical protein